MSLRYNKFLIVVTFISMYVFASCKKDDAPAPLQSGTYTSDKAGDFSSVRLFAKTGEIKDQNLINTYKTKYATQLDPAKAGSSTTDTFFVIDGNNVRINNKDFAVAGVDNYYQFRSKDTVSFLGQLNQVYINIVKYKPYYLSRPIPSSTGSSYITTTLQYYYASTTANGLVFPMINMIYFASVTTGSGYYYSYANALSGNNVFNDKFPVNTLNGDTLLVQTYNVYFKQ